MKPEKPKKPKKVYGHKDLAKRLGMPPHEVLAVFHCVAALLREHPESSVSIDGVGSWMRSLQPERYVPANFVHVKHGVAAAIGDLVRVGAYRQLRFKTNNRLRRFLNAPKPSEVIRHALPIPELLHPQSNTKAVLVHDLAQITAPDNNE